MTIDLRRMFFIVTILMLCSSQVFYAQPDAPPYAKWGQLAVKTAKKKYPKADIVDYLHIGRENKDHSSIEKFKLWLREGGKEFGLFIHIEFDPKNERVIHVSVKKSTT
ncbi:YqzG/YhdC family protein [Bacillus sp. JJ1773]|uniref:YqzG/YhdC family protein n=1 Tax=Bacillus sp. JJ1773 TaxID=3122965 RepID=UPI002FFDB52F